MKRFFTLLVLAISMAIPLSMAQSTPTYLVNEHAPVDSEGYTAYPYENNSSKKLPMVGGQSWYGGFVFNGGYATFNLDGEYETLLFVLGYENFKKVVEGGGINTSPCVVTITADGRKIFDKVLRPYNVPERVKLDIKGVNELKFALVTGGGRIAVSEATLWRAGQTPVETGNPITEKPKITELVKELRPYFWNGVFTNISPNDKEKSMMINTQEYTSGMTARMTQALIGKTTGWTYYNLHGQYAKLSMLVGPIDNTKSGAASGWLTVKADNKVILEKEVHHEDIAERITLDVTGCKQLSFHSEQQSGSSTLGIADIVLYPQGSEPPSEEEGEDASIDPRLKELPDVCKLISNISPYAAGAQTKDQIYNGKSDHITFSMGGVRFSEGIVLYEKANFMSNNTSAYAVFDLGKEFDYVGFTAGYIGKSGALTNDMLRLYADDELIFEVPMYATHPNASYVVPIKRCRKLRFENQGSANLDVGAYGVADIVMYRGEPKANDLFTHPVPETPDDIDLIDLSKPYIHYVSPMKSAQDKILYDGSSARYYFELNEERINKGFLLQTSVHFSLDHGIFSGSTNAAAGAIGGAAVGAAFVAGGAAVGGAVVGSTLIGAAAFLMLAAGGTAMENSLAAFNTYEAYNSVTFTVACYSPRHANMPSDYKETLLIGADQQVVAEMALSETMEPQTVTVPIDGCGQLLFWLANTGRWSGKYLFYDIKLTKDKLPLDVPKVARQSHALSTELTYTSRKITPNHKNIKKTGLTNIDKYVVESKKANNQLVKLLEGAAINSRIESYYLETLSGEVCKVVRLKSKNKNGTLYSLASVIDRYNNTLADAAKVDSIIAGVEAIQSTAEEELSQLDESLVASYANLLAEGELAMQEYKQILVEVVKEKTADRDMLQKIVESATTIDGIASTEKSILIEIPRDEQPATGLLQQLEYFVIE